LSRNHFARSRGEGHTESVPGGGDVRIRPQQTPSGAVVSPAAPAGAGCRMSADREPDHGMFRAGISFSFCSAAV
jgi:hypothetical protein